MNDYAGANAPYDPTFDYFATQLGPEVLDKIKRPVLESPLDLSKDFFFEVLDVKSNYVPGGSNPFAQWPGSGQVPVVRIYGCSITGQSVCVNVWNFSPYLFINCPDPIANSKRQPNPEEWALKLEEALEKLIRKKEKRKGGSWASRNAAEQEPAAEIRHTPFQPMEARR